LLLISEIIVAADTIVAVDLINLLLSTRLILFMVLYYELLPENLHNANQD